MIIGKATHFEKEKISGPFFYRIKSTQGFDTDLLQIKKLFRQSVEGTAFNFNG